MQADSRVIKRYAKIILNFFTDFYAQPYWNLHIMILMFLQSDIPFIQTDTEIYAFWMKYKSGDSEVCTAWCWNFMQGDAKDYTGWNCSIYSVWYWVLCRYTEFYTNWYRNLCRYTLKFTLGDTEIYIRYILKFTSGDIGVYKEWHKSL